MVYPFWVSVSSHTIQLSNKTAIECFPALSRNRLTLLRGRAEACVLRAHTDNASRAPSYSSCGSGVCSAAARGSSGRDTFLASVLHLLLQEYGHGILIAHSKRRCRSSPLFSWHHPSVCSTPERTPPNLKRRMQKHCQQCS